MVQIAIQADLEAYLQKDVTSEPDPVVDFLLEKAAGVVESYCKRTFTEATPTVTLDGPAHTEAPGCERVWLDLTPVTAITSVTENGIALASNQYTFYPNGKLIRRAGDYDICWTWKRQSIVVVYTGGYSTYPDALIYATTSIAARGFMAGAASAAQDDPGVNLERIGDYMAQFDLDRAIAHLEVTMGEKSTLNGFRRVVMA